MNDTLEKRRREAWKRLREDAQRLGKLVDEEASRIRDVVTSRGGREGTHASLVEARPLIVAGGAALLGFLAGLRERDSAAGLGDSVVGTLFRAALAAGAQLVVQGVAGPALSDRRS